MALLLTSPEPSNHPQSLPAGIAGGTEGRVPFGARICRFPPVRIGRVFPPPCPPCEEGGADLGASWGDLGMNGQQPKLRQAAPRDGGTIVTVGAFPCPQRL